MADRYDIEASFYDIIYDATEDIQFYIEAGSKVDGPVLECACGTGRLAIPLARAGADVTGLDSSKEMLNVFRAKLRKENAVARKRIHLLTGDMRNFRLGKKFGIAYIAFASFLHNLTIRDEEICMKSVFQHLRPNGIFIVDVFNPDLSRPQQLVRLDKVRTYGEETILRFNEQEMDLENQMINATGIYDFVSRSGSVKRKVVNFQLRYIFKDELTRLLERTGYTVEQVYGNFDKSPFQEKSPRIICVARRSS